MPRSRFGSSALSTNVAALYLFLLERASLRTCANHRTQPSNHIPNYLGSFGFRILKNKVFKNYDLLSVFNSRNYASILDVFSDDIFYLPFSVPHAEKGVS